VDYAPFESWSNKPSMKCPCSQLAATLRPVVSFSSSLFRLLDISIFEKKTSFLFYSLLFVREIDIWSPEIPFITKSITKTNGQAGH
jgi:hypothetical protein